LEKLYKSVKEKHGSFFPSHHHATHFPLPHSTPPGVLPRPSPYVQPQNLQRDNDLANESLRFSGEEFTILGFPCNQFGGQEPGTDEEIQSFCQLNYGVSFPIMGKTDVNGDKANPLFEWLKNEQPGLLGMKRVKWNFEKW
jgi:hypothetical protein